tara:strand:- start:176 stop:424 length:249 start_codon:yes stop_codon:yes gene_type:complete
MITFIAVMVFINFILLCVNEYGALQRAKVLENDNYILKEKLKAVTHYLVDLESKVDDMLGIADGISTDVSNLANDDIDIYDD